MNLTLADGTSIPQLGYGVARIDTGVTQRAVETALEVGYRHLDTAQMYFNEREVGRGLATSGLPRGDVFIAGKLHNAYHDPRAALQSIEATLERLQTGYLNLFMIHWPMPHIGDYVRTWESLQEARSRGLVRAIGVSNFDARHLDRLATEDSTVPALNQVECHPYFQNRASERRTRDEAS